MDRSGVEFITNMNGGIETEVGEERSDRVTEFNTSTKRTGFGLI
jgi:hypothetical protein